MPVINYTALLTFAINVKQSKNNKKGAIRSLGLLEMIYTDICRYFFNFYIGDEQYLITFIDNFSYYGYVYLLKDKTEASKYFKIFKVEVKNQLDRKIKIIRFNRDGEYHGRYDEIGYNPRLPARFLEQNNITVQYSLPIIP